MELHDLCDDPDYAATLRQDSRINFNLDSIRVSDSSELEVVYSKENVAIHPNQYTLKRITGRLRIIKQSSFLFLTWIPYRAESNLVDSLGQNLSSVVSDEDADNNLYTIKSVPLSDIHSIRRHIPTIGWQYIIVNLASGLAFPSLYFYTGGVREFLAILKQYIFIVRSADDANVFRVNGFQDSFQDAPLPQACLAASNFRSADFNHRSLMTNENIEADRFELVSGNMDLKFLSPFDRLLNHQLPKDELMLLEDHVKMGF